MEFDMDEFFAELDALLDDCPMPGNAESMELESADNECEVLQ